MAVCSQLTPQFARKCIQTTETFVFDCDGVIWHGSTPIPGTFQVLRTLQKMGKALFFLTNNSTRCRKDVVDKLSKFGYQAKKEQVISSSYVAAEYLKNLSFKGKVHIVGMDGIAKELDESGINHTQVEDNGGNLERFTWEDYACMELDPEVNCVVAGLDNQFNYYKLFKAVVYLRRRQDSIFVATNDDPTLPMRNGLLIPGAGTMIKAIETGSGKQPDVVCGKPNTAMFDVLQTTHNVDPEKALMIGDRLSTDILFGNKCGMKTLLVLTGCDNLDDVKRHQGSGDQIGQGMVPHYYLDSLADLQRIFDELSEKANSN